MKIDLHVHTKTGSDGAMTIEAVFAEAKRRQIGLISITDHDNIKHQGRAIALAADNSIKYIAGVELNVTLTYNKKPVSLDCLGYHFDHRNLELNEKLQVMKEYREKRARQIIDNLNTEFKKENRQLFTEADLLKIQASVDGIISRPHIADYLIKKKIAADRQEAFDKYLVRCDVPKYPLMLEEAAALVRGAGGKIVLAHPNDPNGTSLISITRDLGEQTKIIRQYMLACIDGIECWHSRSDRATTEHYIEFCRKNNLITTGGSDCHQKPILMGTVAVADIVAAQF